MLYTLATSLYLAAEEGASGVDLLLPETEELIAGIIAFAIVAFFVRLWAWPAITAALANRQSAIAGQLEEAEKAKTDAQSLLDDYKAQLAESRGEANQIIEEARQTAESMKAEIVAKARAEADEITRKARDDSAAERERAAAGIRDEVARLSMDLTEKVVAGGISHEAQRALVDRYIDELGGLAN